MDTTVLAARAERLAELHAATHPLVLPTVWDAWSARTAVAAGFAALTIGSHPLADSCGADDHEGQTFAEVLTAVRHSEGGRVRSTAEHAAYIAGLRAAADSAGVPVWVNGRTDLFIHAPGKHAVLDEAVTRLQALVQAGADSVYPVWIQDDDDLITAIVGAVRVPVNCTAHPVRHRLDRFARLGVGRVTYGPLLQAALTDAMTDMISNWT